MSKNYPHLAGVNFASIADGQGVRMAIFLSGCLHNCDGCFNKETHDPAYGIEITDEVIERLAEEYVARPYLSGITLTGGDPMFNPDKTNDFLGALRRSIRNKTGKYPNVWLYTGYTFEELAKMAADNNAVSSIMLMIDVLVDGRFQKSLADKTLAFRGSSNQRLIDVFNSKWGEPVLFKPNNE